jgi:hypothetical protein
MPVSLPPAHNNRRVLKYVRMIRYADPLGAALKGVHVAKAICASAAGDENGK